MKRYIEFACLVILLAQVSLGITLASNDALSEKSKELLEAAMARVEIPLPDDRTLSGKLVRTIGLVGQQDMDQDNHAAFMLSAKLSEMLANPVKDSWPMGLNPTYYTVKEVQTVLEALVNKARRFNPRAISVLSNIFDGRYASRTFDPVDADRARLFKEIYEILWNRPVHLQREEIQTCLDAAKKAQELQQAADEIAAAQKPVQGMVLRNRKTGEIGAAKMFWGSGMAAYRVEDDDAADTKLLLPADRL